MVGFRCAHRQTQLSVGWVEDDCIRCRFHGWKYESSGQCVEQPAEQESFAEKIRIRSGVRRNDGTEGSGTFSIDHRLLKSRKIPRLAGRMNEITADYDKYLQ